MIYPKTFVLLLSLGLLVSAYTQGGWRGEQPGDTMEFNSGTVRNANDNTFPAAHTQRESDTMYIDHGQLHQHFSYANRQDGITGEEFRRAHGINRVDASEPFSFILKEPLVQSITREEAREWQDPGWTIIDSKQRKINVDVNIPKDMRQQIPGTYEVEYIAYDNNDKAFDEKLATQKRQVTIRNVDHCAQGTHNCGRDANCINLPNGSYKCVCKEGFRGNGLICTDINECEEHPRICPMHAYCLNTHGGYVCECNQGFKRVGEFCEDIDECATGEHQCSPNANCRNTVGSYECRCKEGFEGDGRTCTPINKCTHGVLNCHPRATCVDDHGDYKCVCMEGFRGDGVNVCEDIDECKEKTFNCPPRSTCHNTYGSYECLCNQGFHKVNGICEDVDECKQHPNPCPEHSKCYNKVPLTENSPRYECICDEGFELNDQGNCVSTSSVPLLRLKGPDVVRIKQFETFSEPGFIVEDEKEEISVLISINEEIHAAKNCGNFPIEYTARDRITNAQAVKIRHVVIEEVDVCQLPESHPHTHQCHDYARCIFLRGKCDYTCDCPIGYSGDGFRRGTGCKDTVPPIIDYNGPDRYIREVCQVCGTTLATPDLETPIITKAYDNTPIGKVDVSDRIRLRTEATEEPNCIKHHYTVEDHSENVASKTIVVCLEVEDMHTTIMKMEALYRWQMWVIQMVAGLCLLAFICFLVWEFGYRLAACIRSLFNLNPTQDDLDIYYGLKYRLLSPTAPNHEIRRLVNMKVCIIFFFFFLSHIFIFTFFLCSFTKMRMMMTMILPFLKMKVMKRTIILMVKMTTLIKKILPLFSINDL